jgi:hypothetical protein
MLSYSFCSCSVKQNQTKGTPIPVLNTWLFYPPSSENGFVRPGKVVEMGWKEKEEKPCARLGPFLWPRLTPKRQRSGGSQFTASPGKYSRDPFSKILITKKG